MWEIVGRTERKREVVVVGGGGRGGRVIGYGAILSHCTVSKPWTRVNSSGGKVESSNVTDCATLNYKQIFLEKKPLGLSN